MFVSKVVFIYGLSPMQRAEPWWACNITSGSPRTVSLEPLLAAAEVCLADSKNTVLDYVCTGAVWQPQYDRCRRSDRSLGWVGATSIDLPITDVVPGRRGTDRTDEDPIAHSRSWKGSRWSLAVRRSKYRGLFTKLAWGRTEATSRRRALGEMAGRKTRPRDQLDLGPVVSVAPDPGDQPWELDVIPTATHMDLVG